MHLAYIRCGSVKKRQGFLCAKRPCPPRRPQPAFFFHFSMVSFIRRRRIKNGVSVYIGYVVAEIGYAVLLRYLLESERKLHGWLFWGNIASRYKFGCVFRRRLPLSFGNEAGWHVQLPSARSTPLQTRRFVRSSKTTWRTLRARLASVAFPIKTLSRLLFAPTWDFSRWHSRASSTTSAP